MRIDWNEPGFDLLLTSPGARELVLNPATTLGLAANTVPSRTSPPATEPYYEVEDGTDSHRARYRVRTTGARAEAHEAKTHALQKALAAGGTLGAIPRYP